VRVQFVAERTLALREFVRANRRGDALDTPRIFGTMVPPVPMVPIPPSLAAEFVA
jgi:hypothetical protein